MTLAPQGEPGHLESRSDCIEWTGTRDRQGYGVRKIKGRQWRVHRLAWFEAYGDPGDLFVLHSCDNPPCYNLDHLRLGTNADNMRDMAERGRVGPNRYTNATHCIHGHEFSEDNTYIYPNSGHRKCRTCATEENRRRRPRRRRERAS